MDRLEKLKSEIKQQQHSTNRLKTRYSKAVRAEALSLQKDLGLTPLELSKAIGVSPKSVQNWIKSEGKKRDKASSFKFFHVRQPSSSIVLELKSGVKISGFSMPELLEVINEVA